ncbi:MAG: family 16 glycoside hydrolase [Candidatus Aminicenantia bacterium]
MRNKFLLLLFVFFSSFLLSQQTDVDKILDDGKEAYLNGDYEKAIEFFSQAIRLIRNKAKLVDAHLSLAITYFTVNQTENCKKEISRVFELNPNHSIDPDFYSPKFVLLFESVRKEFSKSSPSSQPSQQKKPNISIGKPTFSIDERFEGQALKNINFVENGKWTLQNGVLHFDGGDKLGDAIAFIPRNFTNFSISVETSRLSGPYSSQGIIFRADDNFKKGYLFQIYTGRPGMFSIWKIVNEELQALSHWQNSELVKVSFEKWNSIAVEAKGANLSFYINGNLVAQISDDTYKSGRIGLWTKGKAGGGGEVVFDNLKVGAE